MKRSHLRETGLTLQVGQMANRATSQCSFAVLGPRLVTTHSLGTGMSPSGSGGFCWGSGNGAAFLLPEEGTRAFHPCPQKLAQITRNLCLGWRWVGLQHRFCCDDVVWGAKPCLLSRHIVIVPASGHHKASQGSKAHLVRLQVAVEVAEGGGEPRVFSEPR